MSPLTRDTDGDGVDDGYETGRGMNPSNADSDSDFLGDRDELTYGTNPSIADTDGDGDGESDGAEIKGCGTDPLVPDDFSGRILACDPVDYTP
jgi:large repetitive protein